MDCTSRTSTRAKRCSIDQIESSFSLSFVISVTGNSHSKLNIVVRACACTRSSNPKGKKSLVHENFNNNSYKHNNKRKWNANFVYSLEIIYSLTLVCSVVAVAVAFFPSLSQPVSQCVCVYLCLRRRRRRCFFALSLFFIHSNVVNLFGSRSSLVGVSPLIFTFSTWKKCVFHTNTKTGSTLFIRLWLTWIVLCTRNFRNRFGWNCLCVCVCVCNVPHAYTWIHW